MFHSGSFLHDCMTRANYTFTRRLGQDLQCAEMLTFAKVPIELAVSNGD